MVSPNNLLCAVFMHAQTTLWFKTASLDVDFGWIPLICFG